MPFTHSLLAFFLITYIGYHNGSVVLSNFTWWLVEYIEAVISVFCIMTYVTLYYAKKLLYLFKQFSVWALSIALLYWGRLLY